MENENFDAIKNEKLKNDNVSISVKPTAPPPPLESYEIDQQETVQIQNVPIEIPVLFNPNPNVTNVLIPFGGKLTDQQIRTALIKYTTNSVLASTNKAKVIEIINVEYSFAHIYNLLTFNEHRKFKEQFTKYQKGRLDDESLGRIPHLFEIVPNTRPAFFINSKETLYVPHSEKVKICHGCSGKGKKRRTSTVRNSDGSSSTRSTTVTCLQCGGNGQLKYYLECKIKWQTNTYDHLSTEFNCIPGKKIKSASGTCIFNNQDLNVLPINYTTDRELSEASKNLINKSHLIYNDYIRPIQQKQSIKIVPIAACHYLTPKNKPKTFWIIGDKLDVYAPEFPIDIGCSLM